MGVILDSSILIGGERAGQPISELLTDLEAACSATEFLISPVTVMELEHGWHRAQSAKISAKRREYLDEVFAVIPTEPFTHEMGIVAARLDSVARSMGVAIAAADLLIAATAFYLGYAVCTYNIRHFKRVPNLHVISL